MLYAVQRNNDDFSKPNVVTFDKLADLYKRKVEKHMMSAYHVDTPNRRLMPYSRDVKDIRPVNQAMVTRYIDWRLAKTSRTPTP